MLDTYQRMANDYHRREYARENYEREMAEDAERADRLEERGRSEAFPPSAFDVSPEVRAAIDCEEARFKRERQEADARLAGLSGEAFRAALLAMAGF